MAPRKLDFDVSQGRIWEEMVFSRQESRPTKKTASASPG